MRFERLHGLGKRLIIILISLIVSLAVFLLQRGGMPLCPAPGCLGESLLDLLNIALTVAINSQAAFLLLPSLTINKPTCDSYHGGP